jgi:hypothetical protein
LLNIDSCVTFSINLIEFIEFFIFFEFDDFVPAGIAAEAFCS